MKDFNNEIVLKYPKEWEGEYKNTGFIKIWREKYPALFEDHKGSTRLGTLDLFPQYALMYLLRENQNIYSVTWYKLASFPERSKNKISTLKCWAIMNEWMGAESFKLLQSRIRQNGLKNFTGEPDLFCWSPESGYWFFAEAKGKDKLTETQLKWFQIFYESLGDKSEIRIYRVEPDSEI